MTFRHPHRIVALLYNFLFQVKGAIKDVPEGYQLIMIIFDH